MQSPEVSLVLRLLDKLSGPLQRVNRDVQRTTERAADTSSRTATRSASEQQRVFARLASARESLGIRSEQTIQREIRQTEAAYNRLARSGTMSANEQSRAYQSMTNRVRELRREMGELTKMQRLSQSIQTGATIVAGGTVAGMVINDPIRSYASLEAAQADLKIALMRKGGKVSGAYDEVMKQAVDLGNKLPGSTKDFVAAAMALKEQGMPESAITGGGLRAASNFGVLMEMNQYQSATTIAKMREAYGLGDNELPEMANLMQKARYAYGISPDDFRSVASYAAPTYNTLGLTGAKSARELLAVQGMAAGVGLEGSSFGTNFAMMLGRTAQIDSRLDRKGKEAEEMRATLAEHGIKMNFFDENGKFAGIENMFAELEKLKPLKDIDRMNILGKLFGVEAARPASIMIDKGGVAGYRASLEKLDEQSDMDDRIQMKTSTLKAKEDAVGGTFENTKAVAATQLGEGKKVAADWLNGMLGDRLIPFLEEHPSAGTTGIVAAGAGAGAGTIWGLNSLAGADIPLVSRLAGSLTRFLPSNSTLSAMSRGTSAAGIFGSVANFTTNEEDEELRNGKERMDALLAKYGQSTVEAARKKFQPWYQFGGGYAAENEQWVKQYLEAQNAKPQEVKVTVELKNPELLAVQVNQVNATALRRY